jgi:hypothetical protein
MAQRDKKAPQKVFSFEGLGSFFDSKLYKTERFKVGASFVFVVTPQLFSNVWRGFPSLGAISFFEEEKGEIAAVIHSHALETTREALAEREKIEKDWKRLKDGVSHLLFKAPEGETAVVRHRTLRRLLSPKEGAKVLETLLPILACDKQR